VSFGLTERDRAMTEEFDAKLSWLVLSAYIHREIQKKTTNNVTKKYELKK